MSIKIVPLTKGDIPGAVECIQQAFADDPYYRWVFNDPSKVCIVYSPLRLDMKLPFLSWFWRERSPLSCPEIDL
jgi:hypothetical protein